MGSHVAHYPNGTTASESFTAGRQPAVARMHKYVCHQCNVFTLVRRCERGHMATEVIQHPWLRFTNGLLPLSLLALVAAWLEALPVQPSVRIGLATGCLAFVGLWILLGVYAIGVAAQMSDKPDPSRTVARTYFIWGIGHIAGLLSAAILIAATF